MKGTRDTKRQERKRHEIPSVAIAGYTNAGKSSLFNRLTGAGVLVEDSLFATLDPTTRRTATADGRVYTMSDTVGFVRDLPHRLVEAFPRSTLKEVADSDLILHVVDGSHPDPEGQIVAVRTVLAEIGADKVPEIIVINKADAADPMVIARLRQREPHSVVVSAKTGEGIDAALKVVESSSPGPASSSRPWCPTRGATCSTGSTARARSTRSSTPVRAPSCAAAPPRRWPASSRRTPSDAASHRSARPPRRAVDSHHALGEGGRIVSFSGGHPCACVRRPSWQPWP